MSFGGSSYGGAAYAGSSSGVQSVGTLNAASRSFASFVVAASGHLSVTVSATSSFTAAVRGGIGALGVASRSFASFAVSANGSLSISVSGVSSFTVSQMRGTAHFGSFTTSSVSSFTALFYGPFGAAQFRAVSSAGFGLTYFVIPEIVLLARGATFTLLAPRLTGAPTAVIAAPPPPPPPPPEDDVTAHPIDVPYNLAGLSTGAASGYTAPDGDLIPDIVFEIGAGYVAPVPSFLDVTCGGGSEGILVSNGAQPIPLAVASPTEPNNAGLTTTYSLNAILEQLAETTGRVISTVELVEPGGEFGLIVSQDGTASAPVAASVTANSTVTATPGSPFVVTTGTNDELNWVGIDPIAGGGQALPITFVIAGGPYNALGPSTTPGTLEHAIANATATVGGNPVTFSDYVTITDDDPGLTGTGHITISSIAAQGVGTGTVGAAGNGCQVEAGPHDIVAGLGFVQPAILENGQGGDPGASAGDATVYIETITSV